MSTAAVFVIALIAAGLVLLLWAISRAVTAAQNRIPPRGASRTTAWPDVWTASRSPPSSTTATNSDESTPLRAYLSHDGASMLADPALGGNAPCEPPTPDTYQARDEVTSNDHSATEDK